MIIDKLNLENIIHIIPNQDFFYPIDIDEIERKVLRKIQKKPPQLGSNIYEIKNNYGEKILRVNGEIPADISIENGSRFLFISYDQTSLTHGLHKYPAKFFPELPRWLIQRYSCENDIVLDPFVGSGTTCIEAKLNNRHSVGIDVDPFSRFLARVKVTPLEKDELLYGQKYLIRQILKYNKSYVAEKDIPIFPYRDSWFNKYTLLELAYIRKLIYSLDVNQGIKNFYKICFSSILRSVSNADDNCTRTVIRKKLNKRIYPADALEKFIETILLNVPKMINYSRICPAKIEVELPADNDARSIKYPNDYFDLAITSPPYANAVDYPRTHQLEIYWLGFENGTLTPLKRKHIGTESVSANDYMTLHKIGIGEADNIIKNIYAKDKRRAYIAYKYLDDMGKNLSEVYRVIKRGKYYILVVGNNRIRGEIFENWKYIKEIALNIGFELENYFTSEIINHFIKVPREERINTDWILVLRK